MKRRRRPTRGRLKAEDVPALVEFARGYLHEDVLVEYGSALGAVQAYLSDAGPADRRRLQSDLARLVDVCSGWPVGELARFFATILGAAWTPASTEELRDLEAATRGFRPSEG